MKEEPTCLPATEENDALVVEEMDRVIALMEKTQKDFYGPLLPMWDDQNGILQRQQKYHEQFLAKQEIFGIGKSQISKEEFKKFYETTGIDVDNRLEMMKQFASTMEKGITKFIGFAKNIPGFSSLDLDDQANLVKSARFEFWFFGYFRFLNPELKVATGIMGNCYHISELFKLWNKEFVETLFEFVKKVHALNLSLVDIALIRCIVLTFRDRCLLKDPDKVEEIQWKMVLCFQHWVQKSRPTQRQFFSQVFDRLREIRHLTEMNMKLSQNLKLEWPIIQNHPLFLEMLST